MTSADALASRLEAVHRRIEAAGGELSRIRIVAVTKGFGLDAVRAAGVAGLSSIGENYADELVDKAGALAGDEGAEARSWHFLGAIQRNKLARLAPIVSCYESVDRIEEAEAIVRRAPHAAMLVEVALEGGGERGGVAPSELDAFLAALASRSIAVKGLMAVGAHSDDPARLRRGFRLVRRLCDAWGFEVASMGMSGDLEIAVEEGSTELRLGEALFGPRPARAQVAQ